MMKWGNARRPAPAPALPLLLQDAAVLGRCLDGLQPSLDVMVKEGAYWAQEAAKLSQKVSPCQWGGPQGNTCGSARLQ